MAFMVQGANGKEYGPATFENLQKWVVENRLDKDTQLRDLDTGQMIAAGKVPSLFGDGSVQPGPPPVTAAPQLQPNHYGAQGPYTYQQPMQPQMPPAPGAWNAPPGFSHSNTAEEDKRGLMSVIGFGVIGLVLIAFGRGLGITAILVVGQAWKEYRRGNRYGGVCLGIGAFLIVCVILHIAALARMATRF